MAFSDNTIKQNVNVQQVQTTSAGAVTSGSAAESAKIIVPVAVDEELLKLLGLTLEQYLQLPDEQKNEINKQINQIKASGNETNLGVTGLYVEKNPDGQTQAKPEPLLTESPDIDVKAETDAGKGLQMRRPDTVNKEDWKNMSHEAHVAYLKSGLAELLKDVPEEHRAEAIKALVDNRIKETRGFSDERWDNMNDERKEKLRERFMSDFALVVENEFTKEDFASLSYEQKLRLEIELQDKELQKMNEVLANMPDNSDADIDPEKYQKLRENLEKAITEKQQSYEKDKAKERLMASLDMLLTDETPVSPKDIAEKNSGAFAAGALPEGSEIRPQGNLAELAAMDSTKSRKPIKIPGMHESGNDNINTDNSADMFRTRVGRDVNFNSRNDRQLFKKIFTEKFDENLSPSENVLAKARDLAKVKERLIERTQSEDPKIKAMAQEQLDNFLDFTIDLGFDDKTILAAKNGELSDEACAVIAANIEEHAARMKGKKNPDAEDLQYAQRMAGMQGAMIHHGYEPGKNFNALYEDSRYTKVVGDGLRSIKDSRHVFKYLTQMTPQLASELQTSEFDSNMAYTDTFENESDAIAAQKELNDIIGDLAVENQSHAFETIMTSKFDEVQEHAANNIYRLDESVRDWASDYTKSLGKENLTNAIRTEPPVDNTNSSARSNTQETSQYDNSYQTNTISNNLNDNINIISYEQLSEPAKAVYREVESHDGVMTRDEAVKYFKSLTHKEQSELLKSLPAQVFSKLPVTVCEDFPEYIPTFVDNGRGIEIITSCSSITADNAIRRMKSSSSRVKQQLNEFIINNPAQFTKISQEHAKKALNLDEKPTEEKPLRFKA